MDLNKNLDMVFELKAQKCYEKLDLKQTVEKAIKNYVKLLKQSEKMKNLQTKLKKVKKLRGEPDLKSDEYAAIMRVINVQTNGWSHNAKKKVQMAKDQHIRYETDEIRISRQIEILTERMLELRMNKEAWKQCHLKLEVAAIEIQRGKDAITLNKESQYDLADLGRKLRWELQSKKRPRVDDLDLGLPSPGLPLRPIVRQVARKLPEEEEEEDVSDVEEKKEEKKEEYASHEDIVDRRDDTDLAELAGRLQLPHDGDDVKVPEVQPKGAKYRRAAGGSSAALPSSVRGSSASGGSARGSAISGSSSGAANKRTE